MNAPLVLLLEDSTYRVEWLNSLCLSRGVRVVHARKVVDFVSLCREHMLSDVRAIVLDHDLGEGAMPLTLQDVDGFDGLDAAERIPAIPAPVLVWSSNDNDSPRMVEALRKQGFAQVVRRPWYGDRKEIAQIVMGWL